MKLKEDLRQRLGIRMLLLPAITLCISTSCFGQGPTAIARGGGAYEVAGTYTRVQTDGSFGAPRGLNGWTASAAGQVMPFVQLTAEVGGYRKPNFSMYSFMAGPQVKMRIWRVQPFIRGLFGLSRVTGNNEFSFAGGGGLDVPVTNHISVRALQCDYYRFYGGPFHLTDMMRVGVGVKYWFGD